MEIDDKRILSVWSEVDIKPELENDEKYNNFIKRELAGRITDLLLKENLVTIYDYNTASGTKQRRAFLEIIKPKN